MATATRICLCYFNGEISSCNKGSSSRWDRRELKHKGNERSSEHGLEIMELTHRVGVLILNANSESIGNAEGRCSNVLCSQRKYEHF
jgi:hypothetical protein